MLRTNSKKAIENVEAYIMNNYDPCNYDLPVVETFPEVSKQILSVFFSEYGKHKRWNESYFDSFFGWCSGLPSILDTCYFYNRSAVKDLGDILEETEAERAKYSEPEAEKTLTWLIYREMEKAITKTYRCDIHNLEEV